MYGVKSWVDSKYSFNTLRINKMIYAIIHKLDSVLFLSGSDISASTILRG